MTLPKSWEEKTELSDKIRQTIRQTLDSRRHIQRQDTAVVLLNTPLHELHDTCLVRTMINNIKSVVSTLQAFGTRIMLVLQPGDHDGAACIRDFNNQIRLEMKLFKCQIVPATADDRAGAIQGKEWPRRRRTGEWCGRDMEDYLRVVLDHEYQLIRFDHKDSRVRFTPVTHFARSVQQTVSQPQPGPSQERGLKRVNIQQHEASGGTPPPRQAANYATEDMLRWELEAERAKVHQLRRENRHLNEKLEKYASAAKERKKLKKMIRSLQEANRKMSSSESSSSGSSSESEESGDEEETAKAEGEARQSSNATEVSNKEIVMTVETEGEARQPLVTTEEARERALMTEDLVDLEIECVLEEGDEVVLMTEIAQNTETEMTEAVSNDCAEHNPEEGSPVVGEINSV